MIRKIKYRNTNEKFPAKFVIVFNILEKIFVKLISSVISFIEN